MSSLFTVARKESRALFLSPIAAIFLGLFLVVTWVGFFFVSGFWARGLADVQPLFRLLPLVLVGLVSAVSMRAWAEEKRSGTLEVLLTLPVRTVDLVLGKFVAGMGLVLVGLFLTLPIPLTVWSLGPLDWGPVIGGYLGAMLLAGAYMAIGLWISSLTDNQVVALMLTLAVGGLLYAIGAESVLNLLPQTPAEALAAVGTSSRFESIARGVVDLRDLAYYATLTAFFLALNVSAIAGLRSDPTSSEGRQRALQRWGAVALIGVNALVVNIWLAPVSTLRADLTAGGAYSVGPVTRDVLTQLDEPLLIQGVFSEKTHPKLAPLIPSIRAFLQEYERLGNGMVQVETVDPNTDEELENELKEQFGIESVPFRVSGAHEQAIVNSYFHVLIRYGDKHEVLAFDDLIEVEFHDGDIDVRLRNLEYDITRAIKRVSQEFQSLDAVLAKLDEPARLTLYAGNVPDDLTEVADSFREAARAMAEESGGKLVFTEVDPGADPNAGRAAMEKFGVQPMALDILATDVFWLQGVLELGEMAQRVTPQPDMSQAELKSVMTSAVKRATPGHLKRVGLVTEQPEPPPPNPNLPPQMQPPPPQPDLGVLQRVMASEYEVERVNLDDGTVPDDVDVLVVTKPGTLTEPQKFALDQYLMRGGSVIAMAGRVGVDMSRSGLQGKNVADGLQDMLAHYGVEVGEGVVMDTQNTPFPIPVQERRGNLVFERIEYLDYPFFPDIRPDGFERGHPALAGLPNVTMPWASELTVSSELPEGVDAQVLLKTSENSWVKAGSDIAPDMEKYPETGFPAPGADAGRQEVAVALTGQMDSFFSGKDAPRLEGGPAPQPLEKSLPDARLIVLGSSELVSDVMLGIAQQMGGNAHLSNLELVRNLIDWSLEDTDLLQIRSMGALARTLEPLQDGDKILAELLNGLAMLLGLLIVIVAPRVARSSAAPLVAGGAK